MQKLESLTYKDPHNELHSLKFSSKHNPESHDTTVITGVNGSHKSSVLRDIVQCAFSNKTPLDTSLKIRSGKEAVDAAALKGDLHIIAVSGTLADRFPVKRIGGRPTDFDNPNYVYLGQRVGTNLLSKKISMETVSYYLLDDFVSGRYKWGFYEEMYKTISLIPSIDIKFEIRRESLRNKNALSTLNGKPQNKKGESLFEFHNRYISNTKIDNDFIHREMQYMLHNFSHDAYGEWHEYTSSKERSINLSITDQVISKEGISSEAIRLGLYAGHLSLSDAKVSSRLKRSSFSLFDLSSGEYHFLTNILGIGFAAKHNSIILVDEPENSLHPQWQIDFMNLLFETCSFMKGGHIVIATHSPLIVSSCSQKSTIVDLAKHGENRTGSKKIFGSTVDDILLDHFKIPSSRNFGFAQKLQRAIDLFTFKNTNNQEFSEIINELNSIKKHLNIDDPIIELINTLSNEDLTK